MHPEKTALGNNNPNQPNLQGVTDLPPNVLFHRQTQTFKATDKNDCSTSTGQSRGKLPLPRQIADKDSIKVFELCQVLKDEGSTNSITIVRERITEEIHSHPSSVQTDDTSAKRYRYCKEVIKPYLKDYPADCPDSEHLVKQAIDSAEEDFPDQQPCFPFDSFQDTENPKDNNFKSITVKPDASVLPTNKIAQKEKDKDATKTKSDIKPKKDINKDISTSDSVAKAKVEKNGGKTTIKSDVVTGAGKTSPDSSPQISKTKPFDSATQTERKTKPALETATTVPDKAAATKIVDKLEIKSDTSDKPAKQIILSETKSAQDKADTKSTPCNVNESKKNPADKQDENEKKAVLLDKLETKHDKSEKKLTNSDKSSKKLSAGEKIVTKQNQEVKSETRTDKLEAVDKNIKQEIKPKLLEKSDKKSSKQEKDKTKISSQNSIIQKSTLQKESDPQSISIDVKSEKQSSLIDKNDKKLISSDKSEKQTSKDKYDKKILSRNKSDKKQLSSENADRKQTYSKDNKEEKSETMNTEAVTNKDISTKDVTKSDSLCSGLSSGSGTIEIVHQKGAGKDCELSIVRIISARVCSSTSSSDSNPETKKEHKTKKSNKRKHYDLLEKKGAESETNDELKSKREPNITNEVSEPKSKQYNSKTSHSKKESDTNSQTLESDNKSTLAADKKESDTNIQPSESENKSFTSETKVEHKTDKLHEKKGSESIITQASKPEDKSSDYDSPTKHKLKKKCKKKPIDPNDPEQCPKIIWDRSKLPDKSKLSDTSTSGSEIIDKKGIEATDDLKREYNKQSEDAIKIISSKPETQERESKVKTDKSSVGSTEEANLSNAVTASISKQEEKTRSVEKLSKKSSSNVKDEAKSNDAFKKPSEESVSKSESSSLESIPKGKSKDSLSKDIDVKSLDSQKSLAMSEESVKSTKYDTSSETCESKLEKCLKARKEETCETKLEKCVRERKETREKQKYSIKQDTKPGKRDTKTQESSENKDIKKETVSSKISNTDSKAHTDVKNQEEPKKEGDTKKQDVKNQEQLKLQEDSKNHNLGVRKEDKDFKNKENSNLEILKGDTDIKKQGSSCSNSVTVITSDVCPDKNLNTDQINELGKNIVASHEKTLSTLIVAAEECLSKVAQKTKNVVQDPETVEKAKQAAEDLFIEVKKKTKALCEMSCALIDDIKKVDVSGVTKKASDDASVNKPKEVSYSVITGIETRNNKENEDNNIKPVPRNIFNESNFPVAQDLCQDNPNEITEERRDDLLSAVAAKVDSCISALTEHLSRFTFDFGENDDGPYYDRPTPGHSHSESTTEISLAPAPNMQPLSTPSMFTTLTHKIYSIFYDNEIPESIEQPELASFPDDEESYLAEAFSKADSEDDDLD